MGEGVMEWRQVMLGDVCEHLRNGASIKQSKGATGVPITRIQTISFGEIDTEKFGYAHIHNDKYSRWYLQDGDILLSHINSEQHIGKVALYTGTPAPLIHGMNLLCLRPKRGAILPKWLLYMLRSEDFRALLPPITKRAVNQASISTASLKRLPVRVPPSSEQRRIVEILDQADALRKQRAEADKLAARILPALFYQMFGDPATNPKGLRKKKLGDLIKVKSGAFLPAKSMALDGQYPVYGGNGINGYHSEFMFDSPKIVLGRVGAYCGVVHYTEPKCWVTDNALFVSEQSGDLTDGYLTEALRMAKLNQYAGRAGQPLISGNRVYPVEILVPGKTAQEKFERCLLRLQRDDANRMNSAKHIDTLFSTLLHRAFSGDLTVKWRESHMKELLHEMEQQAKDLRLPTGDL